MDVMNRFVGRIASRNRPRSSPCLPDISALQAKSHYQALFRIFVVCKGRKNLSVKGSHRGESKNLKGLWEVIK